MDSRPIIPQENLDLYLRRQQQVPHRQWSENVAAAFRVNPPRSAHATAPDDRLDADDYWAFANVFTSVTFGNRDQYSTLPSEAGDVDNQARAEPPKAGGANQGAGADAPAIREVFVGTVVGKGRPNPRTTSSPFPGPRGPEDRRQAAAKIPAPSPVGHEPENPFFARVFGTASVHLTSASASSTPGPGDDFSLANPPTNPRLLNDAPSPMSS